MAIEFTKETLQTLYENHGSLREIARATGANAKVVAREMKRFDLFYEKRPRKYKIHHEFFAEDNEASFYWAGFIAAGANVTNHPGYRIEFNISTQDREHLELMNETMGTDTPVKNFITVKESITIKDGKKTYANDHVRTVVSSKFLVEDLSERFGITPRKKHTYAMPSHVMDSDLLPHFIRGWTDGLGGFSEHKGTITFTTRGTNLMIAQIKKLLERKLKVIDTVEVQSNDAGESYVLTISDRTTQKLLYNFLYADASFFLQRKKEQATNLFSEKN